MKDIIKKVIQESDPDHVLETQRLITNTGYIGKGTILRLTRKGYKPYEIKDGQIIPYEFHGLKNTTASSIGHNVKPDQVFVFLTDEELAKCVVMSQKVVDLISKYEKQIELAKGLLPSFIYHEVIKSNSVPKGD